MSGYICSLTCHTHTHTHTHILHLLHTHTLGQVRADLEGKLGSQCSEYVAVTYRLQKVAGINYFIKVWSNIMLQLLVN